MFSIQFYQEFDAHHGAFRAIRLCNASKLSITTDNYRILDFFLCFPFELKRLNMGRGVRRHHKLAATYEFMRPYRYSSVPEQVILQMWPFQQVALRGLAQRGILDPNSLAEGKVEQRSDTGETTLTLTAIAANSRNRDLVEFLAELARDLPAAGEGSLKSRSRLLNYAYEVRSDELLN